VKTPGPHGFHAFVPTALPRELELASATVMLLSESDRALGRLAGAGRLLPNPHILVGPYVAREALASSRIEGTQASLSDVFDATAGGSAHGDVLEVTNYIESLELGLERLAKLPVSMRLLREMHKQLLTGVRGTERRPGEIRRSPNWIGSPDNRPETAVFVPPPVDEMQLAITDWERYAHEDVRVPPLLKCALLHYQFETIHPFLDGNGRLGRLFIVLFLMEQGLLPAPLLYVSSYFETHRSEYYDRLQFVRERGEIEQWLQFFLRAVSVQATDAVERAERLADLREKYRLVTSRTRSRAGEVVELLFEKPVVTVGYLVDRLSVTQQGAANLLTRLHTEGIVRELFRVPGRATRWVAHEIMDVLEGSANRAERRRPNALRRPSCAKSSSLSSQSSCWSPCPDAERRRTRRPGPRASRLRARSASSASRSTRPSSRSATCWASPVASPRPR
jgi:Fic family protein